jgi:hypothetical protein
MDGLPKDAPLKNSAYLPARMARIYYRNQARGSVPYLFDPPIAGPSLMGKKPAEHFKEKCFTF